MKLRRLLTAIPPAASTRPGSTMGAGRSRPRRCQCITCFIPCCDIGDHLLAGMHAMHREWHITTDGEPAFVILCTQFLPSHGMARLVMGPLAKPFASLCAVSTTIQYIAGPQHQTF